MELCNAPPYGSTELFPCGALERAVEESNWVLHDQVIHKAVTMKKKHQRPMEKPQFF